MNAVFVVHKVLIWECKHNFSFAENMIDHVKIKSVIKSCAVLAYSKLSRNNSNQFV